MKNQTPQIGMTAIRLIILTILLAATFSSKAQLNPFQSMYYQNQYLYNPAIAGIKQGFNLTLGHRQQWSNILGAPETAALTLDYQLRDKVGVGLQINDDRTGLIRQTRIMGTYAYHVPLNLKSKLSFGVSAGVSNSRVDYNKITGDVTDEEIALYNELKPYLDGDFGVALTSSRLSLNAAIPNLGMLFFRRKEERVDADWQIFVGIASYKFPLQYDERSFILEPLVGYRMVKGYKDIYDAGLNFIISNYGLNFQAIYHTSESMAVGCGLDQEVYAVTLNYNIETGLVSNYSKGTFELGLKLRLSKKKQAM